MEFARVITAMVTPFDGSFEIDWSALGDLIEHLLSTGSEGLLVAGSTGESATLSDEEKVKLFKRVREIVKGRAQVIAGVGTSSTKRTVDLAKAAEDAGADAVLVVTPMYNKPTQDGLFRHYLEVAYAVEIPVIVYNVPSRTGVSIKPSTLCKIVAEAKNVVGIKEASGSLDTMTEILSLCRTLVWSGNDSLTMPCVAIGGYGVVSVVSHVAGKAVREMIYETLKGNLKRAAELHVKLFPLIRAMFVESNPIPVKFALNLLGVKVGKPRPPLFEPSEKAKEVISKAIEDARKEGLI